VKKGRGILMIFKRMNEIEGDFILKVKVSHDFKETYDSASVMVMVDDANGCNLEGNSA
jgi:regulation of enolase protein 1 (concanavalin A-like superfamily)